MCQIEPLCEDQHFSIHRPSADYASSGFIILPSFDVMRSWNIGIRWLFYFMVIIYITI